MVRVNVSVPEDLKLEMDGCTDGGEPVNWSMVARRAFREKVAELDADVQVQGSVARHPVVYRSPVAPVRHMVPSAVEAFDAGGDEFFNEPGVPAEFQEAHDVALGKKGVLPRKV